MAPRQVPSSCISRRQARGRLMSLPVWRYSSPRGSLRPLRFARALDLRSARLPYDSARAPHLRRIFGGLGGLGVAWQRGLSTAGLKQLNERGTSGSERGTFGSERGTLPGDRGTSRTASIGSELR
mgnify:CR=1 FL=1